jgi:bifunctional oligoribonuclease and PAP phosphatase NrnA
VQKAFTLIQNSNHILFATHINPDADTIGSALGLMHSLDGTNKKFTLYNVGVAPEYLAFLPGIEMLTSEFPLDADLVIALDCGDKSRLGLKDGNYKILNIDHHASNPLYGDENVVDTTGASAASVVLNFLRGVSIVPSKEAAACLYTALASDTGFFKYDSVDKRAFLDAAYLVECGANAAQIATAMTEMEPLSKIRLHSSVMSTLKLKAGGKMACLYMSGEMLKNAGAKPDEADGAAEAARSIKGVEISLFLREQDKELIRGSLRSKTNADVNKIAKIFGGGGHVKAAGFNVRYEGDFERAAKEIADKIELEFMGVN